MISHSESSSDDGTALRRLHGGFSVRGLAYEFPGRTLWQNLDIDVHDGELVALRGESGSGKTTLLQCIGALDRPTAGEIAVGDVRVALLRGKTKRLFLRNTVGFAFQNSGLVASWSVRKNLEIAGAKVGGTKARSLSPRAEAVFEHFRFSPDAIDTPAFRLSGGEQQRVSLMRLALQRPDLLILDEPSSALDDDNTDRLLSFIDQHVSVGGSAMVATHDARIIAHTDHEVML